MAKRARQSADDPESKLLPETDRGFVGGDHKIELHGTITEPPRLRDGMLAHGTPYPETARGGIDHEAGIRNMISQPRPVRAQNVTAHDSPILSAIRTDSSCGEFRNV